MSLSLRRGTAWRWLAAFVLMVAVALPLLPTVAFAASSDKSPSWDDGYGGQCADTYWVKKGDQLGQIARWYGVTTSALARANHISNPSLIYPGQRLCIPFKSHGYPGGWDADYNDPGRYGHSGGANGGYNDGHNGGYNDGQNGGYNDGHKHGGYGGGCWYVVQSGDNLSEIAAWHHVSWSYLARVNHLSNPRVVVPGQVLYVCK